MKGEYQHTLDAKGRLFIPAKLREQLGDGFVVTKGLDECLFLYPQKAWDELEQKSGSCLCQNLEACSASSYLRRRM